MEAWGPNLTAKMTPVEVMCKFWVHADGTEQRSVAAFMVEYTRQVNESECIEGLSALLQAGAEVTENAKKMAADKGPILAALLEEKKAPKEPAEERICCLSSSLIGCCYKCCSSRHRSG